jgi:hypothetical protein
VVFQLQFHSRRRFQALIGLALASCFLNIFSASAEETDARSLLKSAQEFYREGQYFRAARYAFGAAQATDSNLENEAYSWVTIGLAQAGLPQAATYFYIRTLQSDDRAAIRRALTQTEVIINHVGPDLLRKYLVERTRLEDYDGRNQGVYLYLMGKSALLQGQYQQAADTLGRMTSSSLFYPFALQLRGTAKAVLGRNDAALNDFELCVQSAGRVEKEAASQRDRYGEEWAKQGKAKALDLRARCNAGLARTYYQMNHFREADEAYDQIPKASIVWTDVLFEQAWNAFAQQEYNRTLGKLVSYKSPALKFVFNSEIDVLRAQSYLALCLYQDANDVINEFNTHYARLGEEVKRFVETNANDLETFYHAGRRALSGSVSTDNGFHRMMNRFVRGPYFQTMAHTDREIAKETGAIERFGTMQAGLGRDTGRGFPGFLRRVLEWRGKTARYLGGMFVKNSLIDYHASLVANFEKMSFIKLEMLSRAKEKLINPNRKVVVRESSKAPSRRDYQYYWSFNGEFWTDELGDYVFDLDSECNRS